MTTIFLKKEKISLIVSDMQICFAISLVQFLFCNIQYHNYIFKPTIIEKSKVSCGMDLKTSNMRCMDATNDSEFWGSIIHTNKT